MKHFGYGLFLGAALILVLQPSASAQGSPVDKGTFRITGSSSFQYDHLSSGGASGDQINMNVGVDYFLAKYISVGPLFTLQWTEDLSTLFVFGASVGLSASIANRVVPFIRIAPGFGTFDTVFGPAETKFAFGAGGGFDFMLTKSIALGVALEYTRIFTDPALDIVSIPIRFSIYL